MGHLSSTQCSILFRVTRQNVWLHHSKNGPPHYKKSCMGLWMGSRRPRISSRELLSKCNAGERKKIIRRILLWLHQHCTCACKNGYTHAFSRELCLITFQQELYQHLDKSTKRCLNSTRQKHAWTFLCALSVVNTQTYINQNPNFIQCIITFIS